MLKKLWVLISIALFIMAALSLVPLVIILFAATKLRMLRGRKACEIVEECIIDILTAYVSLLLLVSNESEKASVMYLYNKGIDAIRNKFEQD